MSLLKVIEIVQEKRKTNFNQVEELLDYLESNYPGCTFKKEGSWMNAINEGHITIKTNKNKTVNIMINFSPQKCA